LLFEILNFLFFIILNRRKLMSFQTPGSAMGAIACRGANPDFILPCWWLAAAKMDVPGFSFIISFFILFYLFY